MVIYATPRGRAAGAALLQPWARIVISALSPPIRELRSKFDHHRDRRAKLHQIRTLPVTTGHVAGFGFELPKGIGVFGAKTRFEAVPGPPRQFFFHHCDFLGKNPPKAEISDA